MENEEGKIDWVEMLKDFYTPFVEALNKAEESVNKLQIPCDVKCDACGKDMVVRLGRTGKFLACSGYPECKNTINIPEEVSLFAKGIPNQPIQISKILEEAENHTKSEEAELLDEKCEKCGAPMQIRTGRFGKFAACSNYPTCKNTHPILKEVGVKCPAKGCDGKIVEKKSKTGRIFYGCSNYPKCKYTKNI